MSPLLRVIYASQCACDQDMVDALLEHARRANARAGLTGALAYTGGHFAQVLEGPADVVEPRIARIAQDPRHQHFTTLASVRVDSRRFQDWDMAWVDLPGADDLLATLLGHGALPVERANRLVDRLFPAEALA